MSDKAEDLIKWAKDAGSSPEDLVRFATLYLADGARALERQQEEHKAEIERLNVELDICRDAIETAFAIINDHLPNDTDSDSAAQRVALRKLNEAVGKATPRLLMERPEGRNLYGLNYRAMRSENELLREALAWAYNLRHLRGHSDPVVIPERFAPLIDAALQQEK